MKANREIRVDPGGRWAVNPSITITPEMTYALEEILCRVDEALAEQEHSDLYFRDD